MQINPLNPLNLITPVAEVPAITPTTAVGTRNQTDTAQADHSDARPIVYVKPQTGELKLSFPPDRAPEAEETLRSLEAAARTANLVLNINRDAETGAIVVKLVDQTSGETVQQIPAEALLHLSAALGKLQGRLFDQKA